MKTILLIILGFMGFFVGIGNAQNIQFEQVLPLPPAPQNIADFAPVGYSAMAFADIDGDDDLDVLITGMNGSDYKATLYINMMA